MSTTIEFEGRKVRRAIITEKKKARFKSKTTKGNL